MSRFNKLFFVLNLSTLIWLIFLQIRYIILILIKFDVLPGHVSCALIGRLEFYGGGSDFPFLIVSFYCPIRIFQLSMAMRQQDYYFDWLDFLFNAESDNRTLAKSTNAVPSGDSRHSNLLQDVIEIQVGGKPQDLTGQINDRKLNRASDALVHLRKGAVVRSMVILSFVFGTTFVLAILQLPLLLTRQGVTKRYSDCINYLISNATHIDQLTFGSFYRSFYLSNIVAMDTKLLSTVTTSRNSYQSIGPLSSLQLVEFNSYQVARIIFEFVDNTFFVHDFFASILCPALLVGMCIEDSLYYSTQLLGRVSTIAAELRAKHSRTRPKNFRTHSLNLERPNLKVDAVSVGARRKSARHHQSDYLDGIKIQRGSASIDYQKGKIMVRACRHNNESHQRIYELQLMVTDLFVTIQSYNPFVSTCVMRYIFGWAVYSVLVASWMFTPDDLLGSSKFECYFLHSIASVITTLIITRFAMVRRRTLQLYHLMACCMALESECRENKLRWYKLTRLYHPVPMHCFRLSKSNELSLFFGFKVVASIFSALFLSLTFYHYFI